MFILNCLLEREKERVVFHSLGQVKTTWNSLQVSQSGWKGLKQVGLEGGLELAPFRDAGAAGRA